MLNPDDRGHASASSRSDRAHVAAAESPAAPVPVVKSLPGRGGRGRFSDRTLLRYGVRPFLVVVDVAAWLFAVVLTGTVLGRDLALLALVLGLYSAAGLYRSRLTMSVLEDLSAILGRALAAGALTASGAILLGAEVVDRRLLATAVLMALLVAVFRAVAYALVRRLRARGWVYHPTLILGAGRIGGMLARSLLEHTSYGLRPVGFLDSDPLLGPADRPVPLLGGPEALASVIVEFGVQDVIVAFGASRESETVDVIRTCDRLDVEIFFVPRLFEVHHTTREMDHAWGLPLVRLPRAAFRTLSWRMKRVFDVLVSGTALVLLAPVMAACALAVRLESGPGCLFRQERIGMDGRPFEMLKFRSLRPVDDVDAHQTWTVLGDDRIGPVGGFLRATSLDELPQLYNILRGDMSIVGPRPERTYFVDRLNATVPRYVDKHRVPAGLTGWAQIHGLRGGDTSVEDRARFDNYYIENWSLWGDFKIILRTVSAVLRRTGG